MKAEIQKFESGLSMEKHNDLSGRFNPFAESVKELIATAEGLEVAGAEDIELMALARKTRLSLRSIRLDVEKTRKDLKEESLREGKAIDGMANIIKFIIVPVENHLQEQEDFVKRAEEDRIAALIHDRTERLVALDVDCHAFDLGAMTDEAFSSLLSSSDMGYKAKKEAEAAELKRIDDERIANEKAEAERRETERVEREKIEADNARLRKEAEASEKKAEAERKKADALRKKEEERHRQESDRKKAEADRIAAEDRAAKDAELARVKAEKEAEQVRLAAPDKDKIEVLTDAICKLSMPSASSDIARAALRDVGGILNSAVKRLRKAQDELS